jgi:hypothetical protein
VVIPLTTSHPVVCRHEQQPAFITEGHQFLSRSLPSFSSCLSMAIR